MRLTYILIAVSILALGIMGIRLVTPEDDWICTNGEWVKHGNPSFTKPLVPCQ